MTDDARHDRVPLRSIEAGLSWVTHVTLEEPARSPGERLYADAARDGDQIHVSAGWPPRMFGAKSAHRIDAVSSARHFTLHDRQRSLEAALAHPDVPGLLQGRWEVLGCDLLCDRVMSRHARSRVRVCLFNYTENHLVEIHVQAGCAVSVTLRSSHEYPEAPIEMAQAIALARNAPQLKESVADLSAHAILQVPNDPHNGSYRHRCMLVMFTDEGDHHRELPVRYSAMVDLRLQRVLAAGPSPCAGKARQDAGSRDRSKEAPSG